MTTRLVHLSDLHFGTPYVAKAGEAVLKLVAGMKPDAVVISGDFTQHGYESEFRAACEFLEQLPDVPLLTIPGNHDVPMFYKVVERMRRPYVHYRKYINTELDVVLSVPGVHLIGLNSTKPLRTIKNGRISRRQLDLVKNCFAAANDTDWRVVVAHHHFAPAPDYEGSDVMPKARRALDEFNRNGVDMILGGHLHRAYIGNSLDVYAGTGTMERGIIIVQCGTTTSRRGRAREREKNSFNVIDFSAEFVEIAHWMFFDHKADFRPISRHRFPKPAAGVLEHIDSN